MYQDNFDATPIGEAPGPPQVGTSQISGDVQIAENPLNDVSSDRWLQLQRTDPLTLAVYEGTFEEDITDETGTVTLLGYIPEFAPVTMSVYFDTPAVAPDGLELLHIDLLDDGNIRVNDSDVLGTYEFDTTVVFLVSFDLESTPPTATLLVRGGGDDASTTVEIPAAVAGFGLGKVRLEAPFEGVDSPAGRFLVNDVTARRGAE